MGHDTSSESLNNPTMTLPNSFLESNLPTRQQYEESLKLSDSARLALEASAAAGCAVAVPKGKTDRPKFAKEKVALVGSGNWGSAIATKLGLNVLKYDDFDSEVYMWVFEEYVKLEDGKWQRPARGSKPPAGKTWLDEGYRPLTEVINELNENVVYLPGIKLPKSIVASPDVKKCVTGATMLVFVIPHNFLAPIVPKMEGAYADGAVGISLIKGIEFEQGRPVLISDLLQKEMSKSEGKMPVDMSVLMGANVANEVAKGDFAEATIGCTELSIGAKWVKLFNTPDFKVDAVSDVAGAELCGALKNVVALGAGFCDGVGFGGGRNRKCSEIFAKCSTAGTPKGWDVIEAEELNGQKLQGTGTAKDVMTCLKQSGQEKNFPLFSMIHKIAFEGAPASDIIKINS